MDFFLNFNRSQGLPQLTEMPRARKQSAPGPRHSSRRRASSSPYADTPNRAPSPADHAADRSGNACAEQDDIPSAVPQPASLLTTGLNPRSVTAAVSTALHPLLARVERLEERISARQDLPSCIVFCHLPAFVVGETSLLAFLSVIMESWTVALERRLLEFWFETKIKYETTMKKIPERERGSWTN